MTTSATSSVSPAQPVPAPEKPARPRFVRRIRLSTFLLGMVVVALLVGLYAQRRRQAQLRAAVSLYRNLRTEGIHDALDQPIVLTYADDDPLDVVLKNIKALTTKNPKVPKLPSGIPIYVEPFGIQEAEISLSSLVKKPPAADTLTLREHLARVLDSLGLAYQVKAGFLMITSKESNDVEEMDPYVRYRDVLP
jgi:hypothetical protein